MSAGARLRQLLAAPEPIVAPGAPDAVTARIVQQVGFPAVYLTGAGAAATLLGLPDVGLLTMTEMAAHARNVANVVDVPIIADADNGHGNAINVWRTVREFEAAGVAAVHIEDQVVPKRCGHFDGKRLVDLDEAVGKIRSAVDARRSPDFVVIARTDAIAVEGFERALERAHAYARAGADVLFLDALRTVEQMEVVGREFSVPVMVNASLSGKTPLKSTRDLAALGFKIIIVPSLTRQAAYRAIVDVLQELRDRGSVEGVLDRLLPWDQRNELVGLAEIRRMEQRYATGVPDATGIAGDAPRP